jgi:hypothetical protein
MRKLFLTGKAILLCLLYLTAAQAAPIPANLYGHWLKPDGSNRFVIGIYPKAVCYENETWKIRSAVEAQGRWQLQLEHGGKTTTITVQRKDSTTLMLGDGVQQPLKNIRTFNYRYRPEQPAFRQPLFTEGSALLRGLLPGEAKRREKETYVQLSYSDMLTGKKEYLFADLDSLDAFSLRIPLHMPVFCSLTIGSNQLASFLVQPGDTLLLALNNTIFLEDANPDYNQLMQRICLMGSNAAFNNQYQHYAQYISHLDIKQQKPPSTADRNIPAAVKKQQQYTLYSKLYDSLLQRIDVVYPPYIAGQRFIDFIKAETRYNFVLALLDDRDTDSTWLQKIYDQYLSQETPLALVHDSYYKLASSYADRLHESRFGNRYSYSIPYDKITERVQKDYGNLLSHDFLEHYNEMQKDWVAINKMKDSAIIQKYFNGNREEAITFRYVLNKITDEFYKESRDSTAYRLYERLIPNSTLHFAANLQQLLGNSWSDDDIPMPSLYRVSIFRHYSQLPGMPGQQVVSVNTGHALLLGAASLDLRLDTQRIRQIDHESEWQSALRAYRGKTVVVWTFSHYFRPDHAARSLYELKKMQERYRGQNVVFLKCIQQRQRSDRIKQLLQYMDAFNKQGQLNDVFYISRSMSVGAMMEKESINDCCVLYDTSGQAHHPRRDYETFTLPRELDSVLAGNGIHYEEAADYFLKNGGQPNFDMSADGFIKTWTLYDSTGHYYLYTSKMPDKPVYELNYDSVYHLLSLQDSEWMESKLVFHQRPLTKSKDPFFSKRDYSKEHTQFSPLRTYRYDRSNRLLFVHDKKKLFRTYRVAFITLECLVLELIQ